MAAEQETDSRLGHRERLLLKFMGGNLAEYERVEMLLTFVIMRRDVHDAAHALMKRFGTIHDILTASVEDLAAVQGIGTKTAWRIKFIHSFILDDFRGTLRTEKIFKQHNTLYSYCRALLKDKTKEESHVLYLDAQWRMIEDELHCPGTSNWVAFYPRNILQRAMVLNARHIVLVHNHPTPGVSFSKDDIDETQKICDLLAAVGISLYDHLVVSGNLVYSVKDMHVLKQPDNIANGGNG